MTKRLLLFIFLVVSINLFAQSPILSNFRIEDSEKTKVYFDSSEPINGSSITGFIISGKTTSELVINAGQTSNHYFSVSSAFTFWDNNTIRYEGGGDLTDVLNNPLLGFTLTFIENKIIEPEASVNRYVTVSATGGGDGMSESTAWTIAEALDNVNPGETIWMKAGNYGNIEMTVRNQTGTVDNPIKIIGYTNSIGDITTPMVDNFSYINPTQAEEFVDENVYPVIKRTETPGQRGIRITDSSFLILKNLCVEHADFNVYVNGSTNNVLLENCLSSNAQTGGSLWGRGFELLKTTSKVRLKECVSYDSALGNYYINGTGNMMIDSKSSSGEYKRSRGADHGTDYYMAINTEGTNTIFKNNEVRRVGNPSHNGHGSGAKSTQGEISYCLWDGNYMYNVQNGIYFVDAETHDNVAKNNVYHGDPSRIHMASQVVRNGAYNNIFENNYAQDIKMAILLWTDTETANFASDTHVSTNNIFRNNVYKNYQRAVQYNNSNHTRRTTQLLNNKIYNNTFYSDGTLNNYIFWHDTQFPVSFSNNEFTNNIIYGSYRNVGAGANNNQWNQTYNTYYLCEVVPSGIGNVNMDPKFVNAPSGDFHLEPTSPIKDIGTDIEEVNYDKDGIGRIKGKYSLGAYDDATPSVGSVGPDFSICEGESTTLVASGGTSYLWNTGETTSTIDVSPTFMTTYTVVISDGDNSDSHEIVVSIDTPPSVDAGEDRTICEGDTITLTATGEGDFLWSTGETTESITVNPTTTTTYSVTASNSCSTDATDDVVVTVNPGVILDAGLDVSICSGENIILTATGNSNFEWNTGETTASISVSPTVTTTYTVTSSNGSCNDSDDIVVTVNTPPTVDAGEDRTICEGDVITLTATGEGNFLWSTGETTGSITVSPTITTTYSVTSSNSCSTDATDDILVTVNPGVNLDAGLDVSICSGENIVLTATGNSNFEWSTGETTASISVSPTDTTTYSVTSSNGSCNDSDDIVVTVNTAPTVDVGADRIICEGDTITLTATGEGNFLWSTGETTESISVSPTTTTTYSVTASNSCSTDATDEILVTVNSAITLDAGLDVIICSGESITLTATGTSSFEWSTGETTASISVSPTATTTYTVTSSNGSCNDSDEIIVIVNTAPTVDAGEDISICEGDVVTLTATGDGSFLWSTGETTASIDVSPTVTTTYSVTASDSNGSCVDATDDIVVTVNEGITLDVDAGSDVSICSGETIILTAIGNSSYEWSTGETTASISVSPAITTTYTVTSTNGSCSAQDEIVVTVNDQPVVDAGEDLTVCEGDTITLTAVGGGNFLWSTGETASSINVSPTDTTTYTVSTTSSCGTVSDEIVVTVLPEINLETITDVSICNGETITLSATSNGDFTWSTGATSSSINVSPDITTTYSITSTIGNCFKTEEIIVTVAESPTVDAGLDVTICEGEEITLTASGVGNFLWSTGESDANINVTPSETTTYTVTSSTTGTCASSISDTITVNVNKTPIATANDDVIILSGSSVDLTVSGVGSFEWSTGEVGSRISVNPAVTTTYTVTATTGEGCSVDDEVIVTVVDEFVPSVITITVGQDIIICPGDTVILEAPEGTDYLWSSGETESSIRVSPSQRTIYSVKVSNGDNTETSHSTITVKENCSEDITALANNGFDLDQDMTVYPNPTKGILNVKLKGYNYNSTVSVYNLNGTMLYSLAIDNESRASVLREQLDLSKFPKGIYFVRLTNNGQTETKKVMVI